MVRVLRNVDRHRDRTACAVRRRNRDIEAECARRQNSAGDRAVCGKRQALRQTARAPRKIRHPRHVAERTLIRHAIHRVRGVQPKRRLVLREDCHVVSDVRERRRPSREQPAKVGRHRRRYSRAAVGHRLHQLAAARARPVRTEGERHFMDVNFKLDANCARTVHNDHERIGRLKNRKTCGRLTRSVLKIIAHKVAGPFDEMIMRIRNSRQVKLEICVHPPRFTIGNHAVGRCLDLKPVVRFNNVPDKRNRVRHRYHNLVRDCGRRIRSAAADDLRTAQIINQWLRRDKAQLRTIFHICHGDAAIGIPHRYVVEHAAIQRIDRDVGRHACERGIPSLKQPAILRPHSRRDSGATVFDSLRERTTANACSMRAEIKRNLMHIKDACYVHSKLRKVRLPVVGKGGRDENAGISRYRHAVCQDICFTVPVIRIAVCDENRNVAVEVHPQVGARNLRNTAGGVILHSARKRGKPHDFHRCRYVNGIAPPQAAPAECMGSDVRQALVQSGSGEIRVEGKRHASDFPYAVRQTVGYRKVAPLESLVPDPRQQGGVAEVNVSQIEAPQKRTVIDFRHVWRNGDTGQSPRCGDYRRAIPAIDNAINGPVCSIARRDHACPHIRAAGEHALSDVTHRRPDDNVAYADTSLKREIQDPAHSVPAKGIWHRNRQRDHFRRDCRTAVCVANIRHAIANDIPPLDTVDYLRGDDFAGHLIHCRNSQVRRHVRERRVPARKHPAGYRRHFRRDRVVSVRDRLHQFAAANASSVSAEVECDGMQNLRSCNCRVRDASPIGHANSSQSIRRCNRTIESIAQRDIKRYELIGSHQCEYRRFRSRHIALKQICHVPRKLVHGRGHATQDQGIPEVRRKRRVAHHPHACIATVASTIRKLRARMQPAHQFANPGHGRRHVQVNVADAGTPGQPGVVSRIRDNARNAVRAGNPRVPWIQGYDLADVCTLGKMNRGAAEGSLRDRTYAAQSGIAAIERRIVGAADYRRYVCRAARKANRNAGHVMRAWDFSRTKRAFRHQPPQ